jgi:hypothetical protein
MSVNLTERNLDYSVFLPSIGNFYQGFISDAIVNEPGGRYDTAVKENRIPAKFEHGVLGCNFLNEKDTYYNYKWGLYSAGHANLDLATGVNTDAMVQQRDRSKTFMLGDSGGFQVARGVIKFDWANFYETPTQPNYVGKADKLRQDILNWLEFTADYSMILDIPTAAAEPIAQSRTGLSTEKECLDATIFNNNWFVRNRQGKTKYLNVLQGNDLSFADVWYDAVKHFPFEGWAIAGRNMQNTEMFFSRLIRLRDDKLLEKGERDLIHVLGTSKLAWACILTATKRALRKNVNSDIDVMFDCASPFLASAYGDVYTQSVHRKDKFAYVMESAIDDKRFKGSNLPFPWNSPIGDRLTVGDICSQGIGDLNKNGKISRSSWDSYSYFLLQSHNVYQHIDSVQRANQLADIAALKHTINLPDWHMLAKSKSDSMELDMHVPRKILFMNEFISQLFVSETPFDFIAQNKQLLVDFNRRALTATTTFDSLFQNEDEDDPDVCLAQILGNNNG